MNEEWKKRAKAWGTASGTGNALAAVSGLLFLGLCMALPLVGKAACGGSGSPGAGPMPNIGTNVRVFWTLWVATAALAGGALANKRWRWKNEGEPYPGMATALATVLGAMGVALAAGWLRL
ncbi:MAG: hypothetical protein IK066_08240 [Kiritimatiellae bacterium]|nr:hypothetical protein [Kiritimatiellia bacterium]